MQPTTLTGTSLPPAAAKPAPMSPFERCLTVWVLLCMVVGNALGQLLPAPLQAIGRMEVANVNLPVGLLIWVMNIPTELGASIKSPALAGQLRALIDLDRLHSAYTLRLSADSGCCEWVIPESAGRLVLELEPDSEWWMRCLGSLLQPLAPEDHL